MPSPSPHSGGKDIFPEAALRIFLSFLVVAALSSGAVADTICRQSDTADFGSAVTATSGNDFLITRGCSEDSLVVQKPVSLSILFGQGALNKQVVEVAMPPSTWTVLFDLDRADLDDSSRMILDQVPPNSKVRLTGYTCPIGSEEYNYRLSRERADAVGAYLQSRGVTVTNIEGRGECCPVSATDLTQNRRVSIEEEK